MNFEEMTKINVNSHTEELKSGNNTLTYLSWAWAWDYFKKAYPDAKYEIQDFNGLPYQFDEKTGYMVWTSITAGGETHKMWLPVMDSSNKAMKDKPYTYMVKRKNFKTGDEYEEEKKVAVATMFDVNKTIMRCLVKNMAMFGLGLYIYSGEDLPDMDTEAVTSFEKDATAAKRNFTAAVKANDPTKIKANDKPLSERLKGLKAFLAMNDKQSWKGVLASRKDEARAVIDAAISYPDPTIQALGAELALIIKKFEDIDDKIPY